VIYTYKPTGQRYVVRSQREGIIRLVLLENDFYSVDVHDDLGVVEKRKWQERYDEDQARGGGRVPPVPTATLSTWFAVVPS
jgi:hypothetical protein